MKEIIIDGAHIYCGHDETVLDAFIRQGISVPFSCRNGTCHTCLLKATSGVIPENSQNGVKKYLRELGYFLPCKCQPISDMEIELAKKEDIYSVAVVVKKEMLSEDVCRLLLEIPSTLEYHAGQYINIRHPKGYVRSYSLSSVPDLDYQLEIHVKRMHGGKVSNWIIDQVDETDYIEYQGVMGDCYYQSDKSDRNVLLIGTGTGLSPLIGIARDALNSGHVGQIFLYHGVKTKEDLYLHDILQNMSDHYENFHYTGCLSQEGDQQDCYHGRVNTVAFNNHEDLAGWDIYLCGHTEMVNQGKLAARLAGALDKDIRGDEFRFKDKRNSKRLDNNHNSAMLNNMEFIEESNEYPKADAELWEALGDGEMLPGILQEFYTLVYEDERLAPFFHGVTKKRAVEKQYSFLHQVFSGEKVYFGDRPRNAHHWMVISNELFDYREEMMEGCLKRHGLAKEMIKRWRDIEEFYRKQIVKTRPWPKIVNGTRYPLDGFEKIEITVGSVCDGCQQEVLPGEMVKYHVRLGTIFCEECQGSRIKKQGSL